MTEIQVSINPQETGLLKEFPKPYDPVVLCDLDKTLIDRRYNITNPDITQSITRLQEQGYTIGLSSDTPLEALKVWRERFGMNGPLVAERGAVIEFDGKILREEEDINAFFNSREAITDFLEGYNFPMFFGNPVEIIKQGVPLAVPGQPYILVNTLREASLSFFVRVVQADGSFGVDAGLAESVIRDSLHLLPPFEDMNLDINPEYGILIASRTKTNKRAGTQKYMEQKGFNQIGMVGDSITDFLGADIAVHYGVGNSTAEYKSKADYIAQSDYTDGVMEIMGKLVL